MISSCCGWLRQRQVADFCSRNMKQFLQFALQIWWKMKFLTISRKINNQLCTWLRQNIDNIYHYWVKFWAGTVISLNSRHVPPTPFISIIYWYLSLSFLFGRVGRLNSRHARHPHPLIPPARYSCLRETFRLCFRQFKAKKSFSNCWKLNIYCADSSCKISKLIDHPQ